MDQSWQKYYQLGQEANQNSNLVLAFYLKTYACELMVNQHKIMKQQNDPEISKLATILNQTFNELDQMKNQNPVLKNKEQNKQQLIGFIQTNIAQVQQSLNQGAYSPGNKQILEKNIAYIDSLQQFGQLTSDLNNLSKILTFQVIFSMQEEESKNESFVITLK